MNNKLYLKFSDELFLTELKEYNTESYSMEPKYSFDAVFVLNKNPICVTLMDNQFFIWMDNSKNFFKYKNLLDRKTLSHMETIYFDYNAILTKLTNIMCEIDR